MLAARIITVGSGPAHAEFVGRREYWINEIRNLAVQVGHESIWVEKVKFKSSTAADLEELASQHDAFSSLLDGLELLSGDEERLKAIGEDLFSELERKLPLAWKDPEAGGIAPTSIESLREALGDVGHILAVQLSQNAEQSR